MHAMSETETPQAAPEVLPATATPERRFGTIVWIIGALSVVAVIGLIWQTWTTTEGEPHAAQGDLQQLAGRVESLARTAEQARRDGDSLRARLDDAAKVNESLREQVLALGERARLVEDTLANLADKRLSGHDAMMLNEAESLLALAAERYTLFRDAQAASDAYRLADGALAAVDDAAFSTVRQSVSAEIDALAALKSADTAALLGSLAALRGAAAQLPAPAHELNADESGTSRWARLLGQFVRVRTSAGAAAIVQRHDLALARQLYALDLRDAEAATLARDETRYRAALADARTLLKTDFDAAAAPVAAAASAVEGLEKMALAPPPPANLGAALKELRNLRATHALHQSAQGAAAIKADARKPDQSKPDSSKPDSSKPDSNKPDSSKPDRIKSGDGERP
jgi:uroporphyrin-3 C-methyltransferase